MVSETPLRGLLGPALDTLPAVLRTVHDGEGALTLNGTAQVWRSRHPVARFLCELMRLPRAGRDVPVIIALDRRGKLARWRRRFGRRSYASWLRAEHGLLVEGMGIATNAYRVSAAHGELRFDLVGFRLFGLPVPDCLRPRCHAVEQEANGTLDFDIPVSLPGLGPVIRYSGRVAPGQEQG